MSAVREIQTARSTAWREVPTQGWPRRVRKCQEGSWLGALRPYDPPLQPLPPSPEASPPPAARSAGMPPAGTAAAARSAVPLLRPGPGAGSLWRERKKQVSRVKAESGLAWEGGDEARGSGSGSGSGSSSGSSGSGSGSSCSSPGRKPGTPCTGAVRSRHRVWALQQQQQAGGDAGPRVGHIQVLRVGRRQWRGLRQGKQGGT